MCVMGLESNSESLPDLDLESRGPSKEGVPRSVNDDVERLEVLGLEPPPGFEPGTFALPGRRSAG